MKNQNKHIKNTFAICALSLAVASGCASKKPNSNLDAAKQTYERISSSDVVNKYSTEDLNVAKLKLDDAIEAWEDKKSKGEIDKRAYIAEKFALVAEQRSTMLQQQAEIENGKLERTNAQMELRVLEADKARSEAEALAAEATALEEQVQQQLAQLNELKDMQAQNTDRGMVLTMGDVLFDTGESSLAPAARDNLTRVVEFLRKYPDRTVEIEGHTDNTGDDEYNFNLSTDRALAVKTALSAQGIDGSRIVARGLGESTPVASNNNAAGRQQNRRVNLIFDQASQATITPIE